MASSQTQTQYPMTQYPMEIEGKYRVEDSIELLAQLEKLGAKELELESQEDHYLRHPARDFRITDEALRMRRVNDQWHITYKGPRQEGLFKTRPEIELPLADRSEVGWLRIWENLGFEPVAVVRKTRRVFSLEHFHPDLKVTLDDVCDLGIFAEVECVVDSPEELARAEQAIASAANFVGLHHVEKRSYLSMLLEQQK
ncbi:MAG: class IV adenylate cyclase [Planctomycetota bacterium]|nr:MAG: class IV adenylate cyclase [Planctomycetota bacterium]